jgi:crossover junction endodeoxyribonuclease RuvC
MVASAQAGVPVQEYAPLRIKQAVTGKGRASKAQVAALTAVLLKRAEPLPPDEADAAAAALCHAFTSA